ncbi:hypothetical protein PybrP1_005670, partial [[Pythium] brassicae (nom. inval.)]
MAALSSFNPADSSSSGRRREWDLTHLSTKYPWLRVDTETIEEFRSPFEWIDVTQLPRNHQHSRVQQCAGRETEQTDCGAPRRGETSDSQSDGGGRDESVNFSLSEKRTNKPRDERAKKQRTQRRRSPLRSRQKLPSPRQANTYKRALSSSAWAMKFSQRAASKWEPSASVSFPADRDPPRSTACREFKKLTEPPSLVLSLQEEGSLNQAVVSAVKSRRKQRPRKPKSSHNILSLRCVRSVDCALGRPSEGSHHCAPVTTGHCSLPVLSRSTGAPESTVNSSLVSSARRTEALALQYSKQLKDLVNAEQKLKDKVSCQIEVEKAKLPLTFLFERNLDQHYCKEKGMLTISRIFSKLQHRLLFATFERWSNLVDAQRSQERKDAAFKRSQVQALAFFNKLASDAYVGSLDRAFRRWHTRAGELVAFERHQAATLIQVRFHQRRAKELLRGLKKAALDKEFKRKAEIQQLLRFEAHGRAMQWSTLRNGFDLLLQNHCARRIQLLFRRFIVQRRIVRRMERKHAATAIQSPWRRVLAKRELAVRKEQRWLRHEREIRSAITIQARARSHLAKREATRRREWLSNENQRATELQHCWRRRRGRLELRRRFAARKVLLDAERARLEELERHQEEARREQRQHEAALSLQRVYRGFRGRCEYNVELAAQRLELAARRVQTSWRRSKGRYVLQLRFSAQRDRIEAQRQSAALCIQCCFRSFRARRALAALRFERQRRERAATAIQRVLRGRTARQQFARKRRATITIQSGVRGKLARRERQRRLDEKIAHFERSTAAVTQLQRWVRGVFGRRLARRIRELKEREEELSRSAALLIQKRARGVEARKTATLLREVAAVVDLEQRRHFQASKCEASQLLQFMTDFYMRRQARRTSADASDSDEDGVRFSHDQCLWLQERLRDARQQIAREDSAVVFLQRMYRGFVARMDFVVMKVRAMQRRELETKMAARIQRHARGFLTRRRVVKLRQHRRLEELKQAYIRERKWKEDEQRWKEQYQREQIEMQIRKVKDMELELREAKRDAELAKYRAEVAAFKKQELVALQELARYERKQAKKSVHGNKEQDDGDAGDGDALEAGWVEMTDEYGNTYYYNESSFESSWDRPARKTAASTAAEASTKPSASTADSTNCDPTPLSLTKSTLNKQADDASTVPQTPGVSEGACCKCQVSPATKECLDCGDPAQHRYCASCFVLEHFSLPVESGRSKQSHDFALLSKVEKRARCQSPACRDGPGEAGLATYYCSECTNPFSSVKRSSTLSTQLRAKEQPRDPPSPANPLDQPTGCFYCENCFPQAHESAHELQHVSSALHFRTGATLCCDCGLLVATRVCEQCDEEFCSACFERIHGYSVRKREHAWTALEIVKDELGSDKDAYCIECDLRRASRLCNLCGDGFCDACFASAHEKGKKQQHTWIAWERFVQVGDWLEILDEKTGAKIYFNIETKESSTKQPFELKPGAERHQLQLQERKLLQKRKALELESEIVRLREQVREIQEREALAQRPLSRASRSAGGGPGGGSLPPEAAATVQDAQAPSKAGRKGLIGRLFAKSTARAGDNDGRTPDERRRDELVRSIRADEKSLVASKMTTRSREEKEAKAAETLGTKQFEAAILHELTK